MRLPPGRALARGRSWPLVRCRHRVIRAKVRATPRRRSGTVHPLGSGSRRTISGIAADPGLAGAGAARIPVSAVRPAFRGLRRLLPHLPSEARLGPESTPRARDAIGDPCGPAVRWRTPRPSGPGPAPQGRRSPSWPPTGGRSRPPSDPGDARPALAQDVEGRPACVRGRRHSASHERGSGLCRRAENLSEWHAIGVRFPAWTGGVEPVTNGPGSSSALPEGRRTKRGDPDPPW